MRNRPSPDMSFLLGLLSLVPNHHIRFTILALIILFWVACSIHIKRPSAQMSRLIDAIKHAERTITVAKAQYTRATPLGVKQRASKIRDHTLNSGGRTGGVDWTACISCWKTYRLSCRELTACVREVESIQDAIERAIKVERACKIAAKIEEYRSLLRFQAPRFRCTLVEYA
ncbi:hypothetical protein B0H16DRAFT_1472697 [Mycena metata]|uniref:Uncharacterized protein n=1 Tax=Mycena metata TaxID=1033252 RepID=A0AAD7MM31_9AGAR|nr:hypothetical protein B0H16DRAFT_1472697 [Mycena metata]